jgi:hypothetical protein
VFLTRGISPRSVETAFREKYKFVGSRIIVMSLIKDLVDLSTQLSNSITDRKTRELLLPLKEKTLEVQQEQLRIETARPLRG